MKKHRTQWLLLTGIAVFVIAAAVYLMQPVPLEVETSRVDCGPMQVTVSSEGRTRVRDRYVVSSSVEGNLGRVEVKEGDVVQRGAILTWITPPPIGIRPERQLEASLEVAEAEKQAADAQVGRARVELEQATRELRRISGLVEHGIRPGQDLDAAESAAASAREALSAATFAAAAAASHVEEARSLLLRGREHAVPVRSPVDGVVLRIMQQSERILPSGTPVAEIGDPRKLELIFEILSTDAVRVSRDAAVIVRDWGGVGVLPAKVRLVEPRAFTKVSALGVEEQRVNVIADFVGTPVLFGDGYRIEGDIVVWESVEALQVPVGALFRSGSDWQVFIVENDQLSLRTVQIGHRNQKQAEVLSGIAQGEIVVLYPDDRLSAGQRVRVPF